jgi:hypothetical protein
MNPFESGLPSVPWLLAFIMPLFLAALGVAIGVISVYFARKHKATTHHPKVQDMLGGRWCTRNPDEQG